jgi:hypothetical protein
MLTADARLGQCWYGPDRCISWGPDEDGINGVFLGKDVPVEAGKMLQAVIAKVRGTLDSSKEGWHSTLGLGAQRR